MEEKVIEDLFNRATSLGFKKSIEEFKELLRTNDQVLSENYEYVKSQGYQKSLDDFSFLIGKKKDSGVGLPTGSKDLSIGSEPSQPETKIPRTNLTNAPSSLATIDRDRGKSSFVDKEATDSTFKEGSVESFLDIYKNLKAQVPAAFEGVRAFTLAAPAQVEKMLRDNDLNNIANAYSFAATELDSFASIRPILRAIKGEPLYKSFDDYSVRDEFAKSMQKIMDNMEQTKPAESYDAAMASGDLRRITLMSLANAANFLPSLAVGAAASAATGANPVAGYAAFSAMFGGQEMASAAKAIAESTGRTIEEVIRDGDESILVPVMIGAAAGAFETLGFKLFTRAITGFMGKNALKNALINVPANTMFQALANTLETAASVYNEVHAVTGDHSEAYEMTKEFLAEEGADVAKSTAAGQLVMMGMSGGVATSYKIASEWVKNRRKDNITEAGLIQRIIEEEKPIPGADAPSTDPALVNLEFGGQDYKFGRREDGSMELMEDATTEEEAQAIVDILGKKYKKMSFNVEEVESDSPYEPSTYKVVAKEQVSESAPETATETKDTEEAKAEQEEAKKRSQRISDIEAMLASDAKSMEEEGVGTLIPEAKERLQEELSKLKKEEASAVQVEEDVTQKDNIVDEYVQELEKAKQSDPESFWSVDAVTREAAQEGTVVADAEGYGVVGKDGDIKGVFKKLGSTAKSVADKILNLAIKAGGIKLDNFDNYLTDIYKRNGFRVVSRTKFNEEFAPEGWNKEKHGTPDVVAMVYDPEGKLNIQEKRFDDPVTGYDEMIAYRDSYVEQARANQSQVKRPEPQPAPLKPNIENTLTKDKDGNFVFHHWSREKRDVIKRGQGENTLLTSREEASALSSVGGLAMYYTADGQVESGVGNVQHTVTVAPNKVYDVNSDPLNFFEEAKRQFQEARPGQAFSANHQVAWITKVAVDNGFDMTVARWRGGWRAQTTLEMTPSAENIKMKPAEKPVFKVGDNVKYLNRNVTVTSIKGDTVFFESPKFNGSFSIKRDSAKVTINSRANTTEVGIIRALQALKMTWPGVKVVVGETTQEVKQAIIDALSETYGSKKAKEIAESFAGRARGSVIFDNGKPVAYVLDKSRVRPSTAAHELWHIILNEAFGNNPKKFAEFQRAIDKKLRENGFSEVADQLKEFSDRYKGEVKYEEYMAEFGGMLTTGQLDVSSMTESQKTMFDVVKDIINKFANAILGKNVFLPGATIDNIIPFMASISEGVSLGEDITSMVIKKEPGSDFVSKKDAISTRADFIAKESPVAFSNISEFADRSSFKNIPEFGRAIMSRFNDHLPELRKEYGKDFNPSKYNNTTKEYLIDALSSEVIDAVLEHPHVVGWYDVKTKEALEIVSLLYPEVETDMTARGQFITALAITSNGIEVFENFKLAAEQYEHIKETGRMFPNREFGKQQSAIKASMEFVNAMVDSGMTWAEINDFFKSEYTAKELKFKMPDGTTVDLADGELATAKVNGAVALGSKIGDGFFMNLWGKFDKLTMDRWFMRTWGRLTGTLVDVNPENIKDNRVRLRSAIKAVKDSPDAKNIMKSILGPTSKLSIDDIAFLIRKKSIKKDLRAALSSTPALNELRKAGNSLANNLDGVKDAPANGSERKFIREVFAGIQQRLQDTTGQFVEMADIQVLLWYPEKILYESFKKGQSYDQAKLNYTEEAAPDYKNGAVALLNEKGITNESINKQLAARNARRRDGDTPGRSVGKGSGRPTFEPSESSKGLRQELAQRAAEARANRVTTREDLNDVEAKSEGPRKKKSTWFESFGDEGMNLLESLVKYTNEQAQKMSQTDAISAGIEKLMDSTLYKNLISTGEGQLSSDRLVRDFQSFMGMRMKRAPSVEKLFGISKEGKRIQQEIKRNLREQSRGAKHLQRLKTQIRNLVWFNLPKSEYSKSEVMKMIDSVNKVKDINSLDKMMGEVMDFITAKKSDLTLKAINKILGTNYTKKSGNVLVASKISQEAKDLIDYINTNPSLEEAQGRIETIIKKASEDSRGLTNKEINEIVANRVVMEIREAEGLDANSIPRLESLADALGMLSAIIDGGRHQLKAELMRDHNRYMENKRIAFKEITNTEFDESDQGKTDRASEHLAYSNKLKAERAKTIKGAMMKVGRSINNFFMKQEALYGMIDIISKSSGEMWGGKLQELVTDLVDKSSYIYKENMMQMESMFMDKVREVYGKGFKKNLLENRDIKDTGYKLKDGTPLMLSQDTAAYLYNQYKDTANHPAFEARFPAENITELMDHIENNFLTQERKELSDWFVNELFPTLYEKYNAVYRRVNRTNMPWNSKYAGKLYREISRDQVASLLDNPMNIRNSTSNGSMIERQQNKNPIMEVNEMDAIYTYLRDMEFFHAYAENMRDIQKIFNDRDIRRAIEMTSGEDALKAIDNMVQNIIGRGMSNSAGAQLINAMTNVFYTSRLGFNPLIGIKQLTSGVAYAADIGIENWVGNLPTSIGEFRSIWAEIEKNSPYIRDRYSQSIARSMEAYSESSLGKFVSKSSTQKGMDMLMWFIKMGDRGGIMGGISNYKYYKDEYMKKNPGATEQQAIDHAIFKFQRDTKRAQQSSDIQDRDLFQADISTRWLSLFQTSVKQYMRKEFGAVRQMVRKAKGLPSKGSLKQNVETFLIYHSVLPMLFQYVTAGFPGLLSDWDEEDTLSMARAALVGNLNGLFIFGDIISGIGDFVQNKPWAADMTTLPIFQNVSAIMKNVQRWQNAKTPETAAKHRDKMMLELMSLSGVPFKNIVNMYNNIESLILEDEPAKKKAMRLMMYSKWMIDNEFPEAKDSKVPGASGMKLDPETIKNIDPSMYRQMQQQKRENEKAVRELKSTPEYREMQREQERIKRELGIK